MVTCHSWIWQRAGQEETLYARPPSARIYEPLDEREEQPVFSWWVLSSAARRGERGEVLAD